MNKLPDEEFTNEDAADLIREYRVPLAEERLKSLTEKLEARALELSQREAMNIPRKEKEKDCGRN